MRRTYVGRTWADVLAYNAANREALERAEQVERDRQRQAEQRQARELVHSAPWNPEDCQ